MRLDRHDARVICGIILMVIATAVLWGVTGVAGLALILGAYVAITGAMEG